MCSYLVLATLFLAPVAARVFTETFLAGSRASTAVTILESTSPFAAAFNLPLSLDDGSTNAATVDVRIFFGFVLFTIIYNSALLAGMMQLFRVRWRVSE
jgi:uncharacterized membrane protein